MTTTTRTSTATAISKPTSELVTIDTHLAAYGLREFDDARAHRRWMRRKIGPEIADTIDQYAEAFSDHRILEAQERLYEALARPGVFGPASSSRFGAMRASAEEVLPYLPVMGAMLDLGCGPGHLRMRCTRLDLWCCGRRRGQFRLERSPAVCGIWPVTHREVVPPAQRGSGHGPSTSWRPRRGLRDASGHAPP